jgi:hypothetical protein
VVAVSKKKGADECGGHGRRVRTFPHVEGNFSLHVFIPVALSTVVRSKLVPYLRKAAELFPGLQSMEEDFVSPSPRGAAHIFPTHVTYWNEQPKFYSCILITLFLYHRTETQNNTPNLYGGHNHI